MYCTKEDVYRTAGITEEEVSSENCEAFILDAESDVDRYVNSTFWKVITSGTATSGGASTLTISSATYSPDILKDEYLWITGGTGADQLRQISSNTGTVITVDENWTTNPDNTSTFRVIHCGHDPRVTEVRDGDSTNSIFTRRLPVKQLISVTINGTSVTTSNIYQNLEVGELTLKTTAEKTRWSNTVPQDNTIVYWYGVYGVPQEIKHLTAIKAGIKLLNAQMGSTHNIPSTYSLPEGNASIGQAYVNIAGTLEKLYKMHDMVISRIQRYFTFG